MYITKAELGSHLYEDQFEAITGIDEVFINSAIDGAVAEAKGYLHKYDRDAIFNAAGSSRNALLVIFVKDIAVWHYINLANPGTDLKIRQDRYKADIAWLKSVPAGEVVPDLPELTPVDGVAGSFAWGSNPKRGNHI